MFALDDRVQKGCALIAAGRLVAFGRLVALAAGRSWPLVALAAGRFGRLAAACTERKDVVFNLPAPWR